MLKCVKYEVRKILNNPWFYIGVLVAIVLLGISTFTVAYAKNHPDVIPDGTVQDLTVSGFHSLQDALNTGSFSLILAVVISVYVCSNFSQGLLKNELVCGFSRQKLFLGKYVATLIVSDIAALVVMLGSFIIGSVLGGVGEAGTSRLVLNLVAQIVLMNGYASIFFFVASLVKKTLPAVLVNLFLPTVIGTILSYSELLFHSKVHLYRVWLDVLAADLFHVTTEHLNYAFYFIVAIVYCVVFAAASAVSVKKVEV